MNRFAIILCTVLGGLLLFLCLILAPFVLTGLHTTPRPPSVRSPIGGFVWTFQDRVDYALWKLHARESAPDVYILDYIDRLIANRWSDNVPRRNVPREAGRE